MKAVMVYIPVPDVNEAKKIAKILLDKNLIISANMFEIQSMYSNNGEIEEGPEAVLIGKTREYLFEEIVELVEQHHSYHTPGVMRIPVQPNGKYTNWMTQRM